MEKIVITGSKKGAGKSSIAFNLAYGLAIEGRSVGILEIFQEKSFMAEIIGESEEKYITPSIMKGIIKLMVVKEDKADINNDIFTDKMWENCDYLIVDISLSNSKILEKITKGKSIIVLKSGEEFEEEIAKSLEILGKSNLENIGIIENRVKEYKREVKIEQNIISKIPFEEGMKIESYDGIPYIYKNYNTDGIIELRELVDRVIDLEYGEDEAAVKKMTAGVLIDEKGKVAESLEKAVEIIKVKINGMLYRLEEKAEFKEEQQDKYEVEKFIIAKTENENRNIENIMNSYIENLNMEKRHRCH